MPVTAPISTDALFFPSVSLSIPPCAGCWWEKKKRDPQTLTLSQLDLSLSAGPISLSPNVFGKEFQRLFLAKLLSPPSTHTHTLTHNLINVCPFKTSGPHNSGVATQTLNTGKRKSKTLCYCCSKGTFRVCVYVSQSFFCIFKSQKELHRR